MDPIVTKCDLCGGGIHLTELPCILAETIKEGFYKITEFSGIPYSDGGVIIIPFHDTFAVVHEICPRKRRVKR